ncbi:hypothetical protein B7P43_G12410 [Cryptotermes secundus]|uniref:Uncharacterized protein n=1 Tax=Cryptotermes secundus TaxID=105785 RepID=A0A2J7Q5R9_9NEOP|nr:hypothetical protein B7P43_G12410 [Cryptotermes secundus]
MPFIDDDLLWCPDNDGKMVDLTQCLEAASGAQQQQQQHTGSSGLGELSQSDLTGLVSSLDEDAEEDLFKQLGESTFELDNFFTDFEDKEENNNNVVSQGGGGGTASDIVTSSTTPVKSATSLLDSRAKKFTIAAANPLLAEKLAAPPPLASSAPTPAAITTTPFNTGRVTIKTECLAPDSSKGRNSHVQRRASTVQQDTRYVLF